MEAAAEEFSARGFAGARVAEIAKHAGVNAQLITYYFGGKRGLFDALRETWATAASTFASPEQPFSAVVRGYVDAVLDRPELSRLLVWQALDAPEGPDPAQAEQIRQAVEDIRHRQQAGELTSDFDPETILVVIWAATMAPASIPHVIHAAFGKNFAAHTARTRYASQLARLFTSLPDRGTAIPQLD
jgi:TetR/AcrR family transcriptional regulator